MSRSGRSDRIVGLLLALIVLGGLVWFWSGRRGDAPFVWAWVLTGLGLVLVAVFLVIAMDRDPDDGRLTSILAVALLAVGLGGAYWWAHLDTAVAEALGPACRGDRVPEAARTDAPPLRIVVLGDDGHDIDWTNDDASWRQTEVAKVALVACVDVDYDLIATCTYTRGGTIQRFEKTVTARIVAARTGEEVGTLTETRQPKACSKTVSSTADDIRADVPFSWLEQALQPYAEGI